MKKKILLSCVLALMATVVNAQTDEIVWEYNDADQTATVISKERWHKHGDEDVYGNCHCYQGNVVIPEKAPNGYTVTGIGEQAFNGCDGLTAVTLPNTLKYIGELAFQLCTNLKEISIPASVERLDHGCFNGTGLEKVYIEDGDDPITIGCAYMVYGSLFWGMDNLRYVYVGRNFTVNNPNAEETQGPKGLFYSCEYIEEVFFGEKVTQLHEGEFYGCKKLKKASIGSISVIPDNCFQYCESLANMNCYVDLLTEIGNYAFANTTIFGKGTTINLDVFPNLTTIGEGAFMESGSDKVIIPAKVKAIGDGAFGFMPNLTELHSLAVVPPTCSVFGPVSEEMYQTCKLFVPDGCVNAYKAADGWKNFFSVEVTGIKGVRNDCQLVGDSYTLGGQRTNANHHGLIIQRMSNGKTRKMMLK